MIWSNINILIIPCYYNDWETLYYSTKKKENKMIWSNINNDYTSPFSLGNLHVYFRPICDEHTSREKINL